LLDLSMAVCFGKTHRCAKECSRTGAIPSILTITGSCDYQETVEEVLCSQSSDVELDRDLRKRHLSLRAVVREIPPVFTSI
jgi:hypothetical protein